MQLHFTGRNIEVTQALRDFTKEKFERLNRRHDNLGNVHVTFHIENVSHIAEATLHLNGVDIHATATADDMYAAIDLLIDKLIHQITKHKEKLTNHH